jgi:hypothetical protein
MANDPIVLLVLGFLLTSVLGGGLAYLFQQRAWRHQYEIQKQDLHHQQALKTFENKVHFSTNACTECDSSSGPPHGWRDSRSSPPPSTLN